MLGKSDIATPRADIETNLVFVKWLIPCFQEKLLSVRLQLTVPQTDTGSQVEHTKALERTRVKELGKMAP